MLQKRTVMVLFWCLVFEGGETEKAGKDKTETVTASRAHPAGKGLLPGRPLGGAGAASLSSGLQAFGSGRVFPGRRLPGQPL